MAYDKFILDESARAIIAAAISSGKIIINTTEEVNVAGYATAQANSTNIEPENIRKGVNILGVDGDFGEALEFNILSENCNVTVYRFIDTEWVDISQGRDSGEIAYGAKYKVTVKGNGDATVTVFKCNGVDLRVTDKVEDATQIYADPNNGLDIIAIATSGGSSSSDYEG